MKFLCANRIAPDGTPHSAASHLGLYCLHMPHKKDARLTLVVLDRKLDSFKFLLHKLLLIVFSYLKFSCISS